MTYYYGLDIGGTKIELAVFNEQLDKLYSERTPTPQTSYEDWLDTIKTLVLNADKKFNTKGMVGLGLPGFVNHETGIAEITNIRVADNKPILKDLSKCLDREVKAENDANCFALSEAWDKENQQYSTVLGLIIGTGFGGGLIFDGKVHSGRIGMAGEVGHQQLNYHALQLLGWDNAPIFDCGCGNKACLDTYISGRGFEMLYNELEGEGLSAKTIIENFYNQQPQAVRFVEKYVKLMAICISNLITVLDPDMIVFGGGLSNFDYIYEALPKALPPYLMRSAKVPVIKKAIHGDSGGSRGAAALFLKKDD
ncbi:N-acetylglucosamine kinase [Pasteurella atlantica]|uniref:N-acetylglucosamine kinase n=1 Tax=Pasteurellaceae TaxID=712 RepID=UPI00277604D5|nr:N-acetylglucosamine kinase [Pasteurella atlantica]MDP8032714.1 N-acetylglucosamine kinase [Pasteurella atlantica]MDP8034780.1 N-acetylglucosamine kinase [Pasteurella atlantica]MDP8036730.1 N-acetylglucosamine kinase [Pasteurella atlantica]MDP8046948.1 N-acetylglucosamine kinase [Pasteurella atlantica]MDP8048901.1 N-acetylglucosamine kinase [Pasteurella atlantica]